MYLIANLKQNKTLQEIYSWLSNINWNLVLSKPSLQIIIAPPYTFLYPVKEFFMDKYSNLLQNDIFISSQDVSEYIDGPYTGEVGVNQLKGLANYSIIGHLERRKMGEDSRQIVAKILRAKEAGIKPIVCFSTIDDFNLIKTYTEISNILFAYEPEFAIGTGANAKVEDVLKVKEMVGLPNIIYGGSIDSNNVEGYIKSEKDGISGLLVGSFSLDSVKFTELIKLI